MKEPGGPLSAFRESAIGVYETSADPIALSTADIETLLTNARQTPNGRARILLHGARSESLHEMVIALPRESFDVPHINFKSGKSFLALSGQFAVLIFSEDGSRVEPFVLGAGDWPGDRLVRLRKPAWHTIVPLAGDVAFLETIIGPFEGNRWAPWFPSEADAEKRHAVIAECRDRARRAADQWEG